MSIPRLVDLRFLSRHERKIISAASWRPWNELSPTQAWSLSSIVHLRDFNEQSDGRSEDVRARYWCWRDRS